MPTPRALGDVDESAQDVDAAANAAAEPTNKTGADLDAARAHIAALTGSPDARMCFQVFDDNADVKDRSKAAVIHGTIDECFDDLARRNANGAGVFVTANPIVDGGARTKANVIGMRSVAVEFDGVDPEFVVAPSFVVRSRAGIHAYFNIEPEKGVDESRFEACQRRMAERLGGDMAAVGIERVFRLAGFDHVKVNARKGLVGAPYRVTLFEGGSGAVYTISDLMRDHYVAPAVGEAPGKLATKGPITFAPGQRNDHVTSHVGLMKRAGYTPEAMAIITRGTVRELGGTQAEADNILRSAESWPEPEVTNFGATDMFNARRFATECGDVVKYVPKKQSWYTWNGVSWSEDEAPTTVESLAKLTVDHMRDHVDEFSDVRLAGQRTSPRDQFRAHITASSSSYRLDSMVKVARCEPEIVARPDDFDKDEMLLNCPNGVVDLRTGELLAHDRDRLMTRATVAKFNPAAACPTFDAFLNRIMDGDAEMIGFLQRFAGYCLTGSVKAEVFVIAYGSGANGKSKFFGALQHVMGTYAAQFPIEMILKTRHEKMPSDMARLPGVRLAVTVEVGEDRAFDDAKVKAATGGDLINAEAKYQAPFSFMPQFKIAIGTNKRPSISGTDESMWRRVRLVPFEVTIPKEERDQDLAAKLAAEGEGILAWAVRGCLEWQARGLGEPEKVLAATQEYRAEEDDVQAFIDDCCILGPGRSCSAAILYQKYCSSTDEPMTAAAFGARLSEKGFKKGRGKLNGQGFRTREGLSYFGKDDDAVDDDTPPPIPRMPWHGVQG
ncbi:MAG: phage/plasmid primase, P4 family [Acidobacteriota bacterium]